MCLLVLGVTSSFSSGTDFNLTTYLHFVNFVHLIGWLMTDLRSNFMKLLIILL